MRTQKESHRARGTHILETASGGRRQDTKTIPPSEGHSRPGDGIGRDKSGHRSNPTERRALTPWRRHRDRQVRTQKQSHRAMGTHQLETASRETSQDTETIPPSEGHSPTKDGIGRDRSGHKKDPTKQGRLTAWRGHREGQVRTQKQSDRAMGTHTLETASGGQVRTQKQSHRTRGTHILETASGGTSQDTERKVEEITI